MAKTSFQLIPPEFDLSYSRTLNSSDRFVHPSVRLTRRFTSRVRRAGLNQRTLLPEAQQVWATLTLPEKGAWEYAGFIQNLTGFKSFLIDYVLRKKQGMTGYSQASQFYQARVGRVTTGATNRHVKLAQLHPLNYWVLRKVHGTRSQYEPVAITESFGLPLTLTISAKVEFTDLGAEPYAKFYALVESHYQGTKIETRLDLDLTLGPFWDTYTGTLSSVKGLVRGYTVYFECDDIEGSIFFDNLKIEHSGHNWARDPKCNAVATSYTRGFFQIPKNWVGVILNEGSFLDTVFYNGL